MRVKRSRWRGAKGLELPGVVRYTPRGDKFAVAADAYLSNHADEWGERHRAGLMALVRMHAGALADIPVNRITTEQVANTLRPIWNGPGNNRGNRLRRLIESILTAKQVEPNPATWARLRELLSKKIAEVKPRAAMAARTFRPLWRRLARASKSGVLKFVILTGVRRKEALGATWREFDLDNRAWIVPASRMKMKRDHAVPLTDAMIACLGPRGDDDTFVFPSSRTGGILGHEALSMRSMARRFTASARRSRHGRRSRMTAGPIHCGVIKAVLAHGKGDAVTAAYLRSDLFKARRKLMDAWSAFAMGNQSS